jgi:hypothetical protein
VVATGRRWCLRGGVGGCDLDGSVESAGDAEQLGDAVLRSETGQDANGAVLSEAFAFVVVNCCGFEEKGVGCGPPCCRVQS